MNVPATQTQTRQTIVRLLSSMASAKEISQYLKRFSQLDAKRFAVVKVGGAVLRDDLEALTSSLAFLQEVGLTPIVIHGAGPQLDQELAAAGIEKQTVNGLRVTTPEALAIVRKVFQASNLRLVEALQQGGARATSITGGVLEAQYLDRDTYGLVGEVTAVNLAPIEASLQAGSIPVIASLGETAGGQILTVQTKGDSGPLMWVLVDPDLPLEDRFLGIYTTNTAVPDDPGRYVATFQIMDGMLEFHLFEMDGPPPEARLIEEPGPA